VIVPPELRRKPLPAQVTPVVIRFSGEGATAVPPRVGRMVAIAIILAVLVSGAIGLAGLVLGLGAAVAPALPAVVQSVAGGPVLTFGEEGIGAGRFNDARSIGLDAEGRIYVGEYQGGRIQVLDNQGTFVTQWFAEKELPLTGMAVQRDGRVYTVQGGELLQRDGMTGEVLGKIAYTEGDQFEDVALLADGGLVAAWILFQDDLVVFDRSGDAVLTVPEAVSSQTGASELLMRVAADGRGDLLALGEFNNAVFRFDSSGRFLNRFGSSGDEPGQLRAPLSIAVDGQGRVYVGDFWGVEVFDRDGRFVRRLDVEGAPYGITFDDVGDLWVVNGKQVMKYDLASE
jgi:hypothetical protein